jgi:hypothetical protein
LDLGPEQIKQLEKDGRRSKLRKFISTPVYTNGVYFHLKVFAGEGADRKLSVCLLVGVDAELMRAALGLWTVDQGVSITALLTTPAKTHKLNVTLTYDHNYGIADSLNRSRATIEEVVAPYLVDGRLKLSARITSVV